MIERVELTEDQVKTAAKWWKDQLKSPVFDNGDNSFTGFFTSTMAHMVAEQYRPTEDQIERFGEILERKIAEENPDYIRVDYGPCQLLYDALEEAGMDTSVDLLPWKTCMWLRNGAVKVALGYGAEPERIL